MISRRAAGIAPFQVMHLLGHARALEAEGRDLVHMEIGEPDFATPDPIVAAGRMALEAGRTKYTPSLGLPALREAIARHYQADLGVTLGPERVLVTPGASGALLLVLGVLLDPGDEVLLADPGYPCNRHFAAFLDARPRALPVGPETAWQLTWPQVEAAWGPRTRVVLVADPSNPTGTRMDPGELARIHAGVRERGGVLVVDEIYQELVYDRPPRTALSLGDDLFVVNSFSKYHGMTGWRLGWAVAPAQALGALERLAQNLFLAAPTIAQHAAVAAFDPLTRAETEARRRAFRERRDFLVPALKDLGFEVPAHPDGAFYVYAGCRAFGKDSQALSEAMLEGPGVVVTPGSDFGRNRPEDWLRFAYTTGLERLREGVERLRRFL